MDADNTHVSVDALKNMVIYFNEPNVMCVSPAMAIYNPKGVLQRVQQVEYMLGVYLRKAFSTLNAEHITPGAFSVYRKSFFDKHGGFDEHNLTEDLEVALRIQANNYVIRTSLNAVVYTDAPNTFNGLLKQRRRWYTGLLRNLWDYRRLFSKKYGALGLIVLPVAILTFLISVLLTILISIKSIINLKNEIILLQSVNFHFSSIFEINRFIFERYLFYFFSDPKSIFFIIFILILVGYMMFSKHFVKKYSSINLSIFLFSLFYSFLFAFWWTISFIYTLFNRRVSWR